MLATTVVDDQVDAQPLIIPGVHITAGNNQGQHDVAYIVTENNTVYAIDANAGTVLLSQNLGTPVTWPLSCNNNGPHVGIDSTPVVDVAGNTLYVIAYTRDTTGPAYRLHALDLGNLTDKVAAQLITAANTLSDGTTYAFNAIYQRQRSSLILANGNLSTRDLQASATMERSFFAGLAAGLERGYFGAALRQSSQRHPGHFSRQFLSVVHLDVGKWSRR